MLSLLKLSTDRSGNLTRAGKAQAARICNSWANMRAFMRAGVAYTVTAAFDYNVTLPRKWANGDYMTTSHTRLVTLPDANTFFKPTKSLTRDEAIELMKEVLESVLSDYSRDVLANVYCRDIVATPAD